MIIYSAYYNERVKKNKIIKPHIIFSRGEFRVYFCDDNILNLLAINLCEDLNK
jgi:hypothetical protein